MKGKVALLAVGSYNPPTIAHLRMLEVAKFYIESEFSNIVLEGIMSPVADSYNHKKTLISANHRIQMVREATKSSSWIRADDWECTQNKWTRTLGVLEYHKNQVQTKFGKDVKLMLVVGGDVIDSFKKVLPDGSRLWNTSDIIEIITKFGLICITREGSDPLHSIQELPEINNLAQKLHVIQDSVCPNSLSSTRLRTAIAKNQSIKYATPDEVISYIEKHNLYKS